MRDYDIQSIIQLLRKAQDEYNEASYLHDDERMEKLRIRVNNILLNMPDEYSYLESKGTSFNASRLEDDLPDLIDELEERLASQQ